MNGKIIVTLAYLGLCAFSNDTEEKVLTTHAFLKDGTIEVVAYGPPFRTYELQMTHSLNEPWFIFRSMQPNKLNETQEDGDRVSISLSIDEKELFPPTPDFSETQWCQKCVRSEEFIREWQQRIADERSAREQSADPSNTDPFPQPPANPYEHVEHDKDMAPPPSPRTAYFRFIGRSPANWITVPVQQSTSGEIVVAFHVTEAVNIGGIATDVLFDTNVVSYVGYSTAPFLTEGSAVDKIELIRDERLMGPGKVSVTIGRKGMMKGISGNGDLFQLRFKSKDMAQKPAFVFTNTVFQTMTGDPVVDPLFIKPSHWQTLNGPITGGVQ